MAIRFLAHGAERTGPPIYLLRLLRWWSQNAPELETELVLARDGDLSHAYEQATTVWVARLDRRSPERIAQRAAIGARLDGLGNHIMSAATRARLPREQPDITVVNGATAPTVELLRALRPLGQVVTIAHELSTGWCSNLSAADRSLLLSRTDRFLAVSSAVRRFLVEELAVSPADVTVIHPPVDHAEFADCSASDERVVTGSGVTDWRKAPEIWLRVAALVKERRAPEAIQFVWLGGDGPGTQAFWPLEHEMRHLNLGDEVTFMGQVEDPARHLTRAAVFVSTAREDAYPLACAESIALGVPVVGFDGDGVGEMVQESGCGIVVPYPREDLIAGHVISLLENRELRLELAAAGRHFAQAALDVSVIAPAVADWILERS